MRFSQGLKNEFETAVVNEPSVFEPLKFYCNELVSLGYLGPIYIAKIPYQVLRYLGGVHIVIAEQHFNLFNYQ